VGTLATESLVPMLMSVPHRHVMRTPHVRISMALSLARVTLVTLVTATHALILMSVPRRHAVSTHRVRTSKVVYLLSRCCTVKMTYKHFVCHQKVIL